MAENYGEIDVPNATTQSGLVQVTDEEGDAEVRTGASTAGRSSEATVKQGAESGGDPGADSSVPNEGGDKGTG